ELVAKPGVHRVLELFEEGRSSYEATHPLCKHDLGPVTGRDIVGRIDHPEGFFGVGGGNYQSVGHTVVGAGKGDVGSIETWILTKFFFELALKSRADRDDRDVDCLEEMAFFVGCAAELEV